MALSDTFFLMTLQATWNGLIALMGVAPCIVDRLFQADAVEALQQLASSDKIRNPALQECAVRGLKALTDRFGIESNIEAATISLLMHMLRAPGIFSDASLADALYLLTDATGFRKEIVQAGGVTLLSEILANETRPERIALAVCAVVNLTQSREGFLADPCAVEALVAVLRTGLEFGPVVRHQGGPMKLRQPALKMLSKLVRFSSQHDVSLRQSEGLRILLEQLARGALPASEAASTRVALCIFAARDPENAGALVREGGRQLLVAMASEKGSSEGKAAAGKALQLVAKAAQQRAAQQPQLFAPTS